MKSILTFFTVALIINFSLINAQNFDGNWSVQYVTSDSQDSLNSAGLNVISVTTLTEDSFVALINRGSNNSYYIVGYKNTGINSGRLGNIPYQRANLKTKWIYLFDQEFLYDANDLASKGNLIYVANNDSLGKVNSILVFEMRDDSVYTHPQRYKINSYIWAIDIDSNGRLYVTKFGDETTPGKVTILENPDVNPKWNAEGTNGTILQEFSLPDIGQPRGITVNNEGTIIYVSNYDENKIYCYVGDPINGYQLYNGFNFVVDNEFTGSDNTPRKVGPFGLQLMPDKNLLFIAHDLDFTSASGVGYEYGRIFIANPNTGEILDTIDAAAWNLFIEGVYNNHNPQNKASGYASNYAVDFDENYNVYTQSWFGWTVDKWIYSGELPTVDITITNVEIIDNQIPNSFSLEQNYPNPFNPTTNINFSLTNSEQVSLSVYTITGELVTDLVKNASFTPGNYKITVDASNLSSGVYLYSLKTSSQIITKKMTLIK